MNNPFIEALLFLLHNAHFSGNHPGAMGHIEAVKEFVNEPPLVPGPTGAGWPTVQNETIVYRCGCVASGPSLGPLPSYCPEHGNPDSQPAEPPVDPPAAA